MVAKAGLGIRIKKFSWARLACSNPHARAPAQIHTHKTDQDKAQPETDLSIRKEHNSFLDPFSKECSPHTNHQGRLVGLASARETFPTPVPLEHLHCLTHLSSEIPSPSVYTHSSLIVI